MDRARNGWGPVRVAVGMAAMCAATALAAWAQTPTAPPAAAPPRPVGVIGAPAGSGPWPAVAEAVASLRTHTIYRPAQMPDDAMPLVLWANGACADDGLGYAQFLREIASHGFFVVSLGYPRVEPPVQTVPAVPPAATPARGAAPARGGATPTPRPADPTQYTQLLDAIAWADAQGASRGGPFSGRIDASRIAVMGHSCGGLQAITAAADPRIDTLVVMNSGVLNAGPSAGLSGIQVVKDQLRQLHTPVAYISGGPTDVAQPNAADDVSRITHVPVFWAFDNSGHGGTYRMSNGGEYGRVATAWLAWQLKGDATAGRMFTGAVCGLCTNAAWTVTRKGIE